MNDRRGEYSVSVQLLQRELGQTHFFSSLLVGWLSFDFRPKSLLLFPFFSRLVLLLLLRLSLLAVAGGDHGGLEE